MWWFSKHWVAILIAVVAIVIGIGLAMAGDRMSGRLGELKNKLPDSNKEEVGPITNETTEPAASSGNVQQSDSSANKLIYPTPIPLPSNMVPWYNGPSNMITVPSSDGLTPLDGLLPSNEVPWGTGPSQP